MPELPYASEGHAYEPVHSGYDVSPGQAYPPHFLSYSEPGLGRDLQFPIPAEALVPPPQLTQEELRNLHASAGLSVGGLGSSSGYGSSGYGSPQLREEELRNLHVGAGVAIGGPSVSSGGYGYDSPQVKEEVVRNIQASGDVSIGGASGYGYSAGPVIREEIRNIGASASVSVGGGSSGYGYNSPQVKEEVIEEVVPSQEKIEVVQEQVQEQPSVVEQRTEIVEPVIQQKNEIVDQVVETGPIEHVKEEILVDQEPLRVTEHVENNMVETVQSPSSPNIFRNLPKAPVTFRKEINSIN